MMVICTTVCPKRGQLTQQKNTTKTVLKVTWLLPSQEIHSNFCGTVRVTAVRQ